MPPQSKTIQDIYNQFELDRLYAGKSSGEGSNLVRAMQSESRLQSMPQSGAITPLLPTGPVDLTLETLLTGMSHAKGVDPRLAILSGLAAGRYSGKVKDMAVSGTRKGLGRVLTQTRPLGYNPMEKAQEVSKLLGTPQGVKKIIRDEPLRTTWESRDIVGRWKRAVDQKDSSQFLGREFPFRKMFGLKPRWGSEQLYKKNKDGTYSFKKSNKYSEELRRGIRSDLVRNESSVHSVMGGYSAKDKFVTKKGKPVITREYEDRWDFDINPGEKINIPVKKTFEGGLDPVTYISRYLASKLTKPMIIKGKVNVKPVKSRDPSTWVGSEISFNDFNLVVKKQITQNKNIPDQKWFDAYVEDNYFQATNLRSALESVRGYAKWNESVKKSLSLLDNSFEKRLGRQQTQYEKRDKKLQPHNLDLNR